MKKVWRGGLIFILLFLGLINYQSVFASNFDSPWPMYRGNVKHTALSPYDTSVVGGSIKWQIETGGAIETSPAIAADGTIYAGSWDHNLYALTLEGKIKWKFDAGGLVRSAPAVDKNGIIYVMATFDPQPSRFNPDYTEGRGKFYAINPDGSKRWDYETGGIIDGIGPPITIGLDGTIYVGGASVDHPDYPGKAWFYAFNPDGTIKWQITEKLGAVYTGAAIDDGGNIYFGSTDGKLYKYDRDGNKQWEFLTGGPIASSVAIGADGTLYFGSNDNRYSYTNKGDDLPADFKKFGKLWAVNPDGTEKWQVTFDDWAETSPAIAKDGTIYIGANDAYLHAVSPEGKEKWKFKTGGQIDSSSPTIGAEGTVYFGSYDGYFYAVTPQGKEKWKVNVGGASGDGAIGTDGTIYVGSWSKNLYAIGGGNNNASDKSINQVADVTMDSNKSVLENFGIWAEENWKILVLGLVLISVISLVFFLRKRISYHI